MVVKYIPNRYQLLKEENDRLRKTLDEKREDDLLVPFVARLGEAVLLLLATTPVKRWPRVAKLALDHMSKREPGIADMYKARLPKD